MKQAAPTNRVRILESVDDERVSLIRLLLSFVALLVILIDPSEPDRFVGITYATLVLYCAFSLSLYILSRIKPESGLFGFTHWIDVVWFSLLVSLSSGTGSIFFFFYLFAILVASFKWGFTSGLRVAGVSAAVFLVVAIANTNPGSVELNRLLIRPSYLLILGYLIAYWGGRELVQRRRLELLGRISNLTGPDDGLAKAIEKILREMREFYEAEGCLLLLRVSEGDGNNWFEISESDGSEAYSSERSKAADVLIDVPGSLSIVCNGRRNARMIVDSGKAMSDRSDRNEQDAPKAAELLFDLLGERPFATAPLFARNESIGRLFVLGPGRRISRSEKAFLILVCNQVGVAVEHLTLMESLASGAVTRQRRKISYDLHDGTIQPYIGLKLGLEALEIKAGRDNPISGDIRRLIVLADETIADLRNFVKELKDEKKSGLGAVLGSALEQQAVKFKENYGIRVDCDVAADLSISDRLAAEVFQMITEGLSNIRRHTEATSVTVRVTLSHGELGLEIRNLTGTKAPEFVPRSISERTISLGGTAEVDRREDQTSVLIRIPVQDGT